MSRAVYDGYRYLCLNFFAFFGTVQNLCSDRNCVVVHLLFSSNSENCVSQCFTLHPLHEFLENRKEEQVKQVCNFVLLLLVAIDVKGMKAICHFRLNVVSVL